MSATLSGSKNFEMKYLLMEDANQPSQSQPEVSQLDLRDNVSKPRHHVSPGEASKNKLGTLNGCYVPCLLNIMGIILFERLGWGIGQVGVSGVLLIFLIAEIQSIFTVLSLCALVTNGAMKGGGSYYMISRTLGPEFGGSIGLLFYAAYCVGVAFYASGFAEEVVRTWFMNDMAHPSFYWLTLAFSSAILFLCLVVALIGAECFTRINVILFGFQFLAIFIGLLACFFRSEHELQGQEPPCVSDGVEYDFVKYEWSWARFTEAWRFTCPSCFTFAGTFAVLFPAATGIMEGANLSGDLKNPSYSIPVGTLAAVGTSIVFYVLLIISFAGSFNLCTLREDTTIMQEAAWGAFGTYLVISGIIISASSSALGSLFGASRVLQAIARDKLFPYTSWFAYGSKHGDEPRVAVLVTWGIAQALVFVGSLNAIAEISTAFFCLSYATVNFSCFLLAVSGTPNFRPSFKYFSWHTCLFGTISNFAVMFYVNWSFGVAAFVIECGIFAYLLYRAPETEWGEVTQSIMFHQVRKYLLKLDERKSHVKAWRPAILLLADSQYPALIDFCNNLKKGGLYIIGASVHGAFGDFAATSKLKREWMQFIDMNNLKAFPHISCAPQLRHGLENIILLSGLGALQPNTIVLPILRIQSLQLQTQTDDVSAVGNNDAEVTEQDDDDNKKDEELLTTSVADSQLQQWNISSLPDNENDAGGVHIDALVPQTPAVMDALQYTTLCRNILSYDRNVIITANFQSFDSQLIVSNKLQKRLIKKVDVNPGNVQQQQPLLPPQPPPEEQEQQQQQSTDKKNATHYKRHDSEAFLDQSINHDFLRNVSVPTSRKDATWIDVWLFAKDYTFDAHRLDDNCRDNVFPMLMMQFSHILLQNKHWSKRVNVKLRVLLFVDNKWSQTDKQNFDALLEILRLSDTIDQLQVLKKPENYSKPSWDELIQRKKNSNSLKKYYNSLNSTIKSLSSETYFTFIKLPEFPPCQKDDEALNKKLVMLYYQSLYVLLRGLPPTALIQTGEQQPVISTTL